MALPDWRNSTFTRHGKTANARKRKLATLAVKPNEINKAAALVSKLHRQTAPSTTGMAERIAALTQHISALQAQLDAAKQAQAQLTEDLKRARHELTQTQAKLESNNAERQKAVQRYYEIYCNYSKLSDKYNELCDMVQASICAPINPYGSIGDDGFNGNLTSPKFKEEIKADLAATQVRRLCIQLGDKTPPPPSKPLDAITSC